MAIRKRLTSDGKARYLVRVNVVDNASGVRNWRNVGTFTTKREAEVAEREALQKRDRGTLLDPSTATVGLVLDEWFASIQGRVSSQTLSDYEITLRLHLKPSFGAVKVQKLTTEAIRAQYRVWQDAGRTPRHIRGCHLRLSQAMSYAMARGIIYANPCAAVKPPTLSARNVDVWDAQEASAFLQVAMNRPQLHRGGDSGIRLPDELSPLWHFLLMEGMRRGEAMGLRWSDVNWERGTAHIVQTVVTDKSNRGSVMIQDRAKTKASSRAVRLTPDTIAVLKDHRKAQVERRLKASDWVDHDLIICTGNGSPVNPSNVYRSFAILVKHAEVRQIRVHDLRHTHATLLLKAGVPAKVVSERLGHASIAITLDTYSHVLPDMQDAAADAISAAIGGRQEVVSGGVQ